MAEPIQVFADFTGESTVNNSPQPPTINELVAALSADLITLFCEQQQRINELEAQASK